MRVCFVFLICRLSPVPFSIFPVCRLPLAALPFAAGNVLTELHANRVTSFPGCHVSEFVMFWVSVLSSFYIFAFVVHDFSKKRNYMDVHRLNKAFRVHV